VHANHQILDRPIAGVALTAEVRSSDSEPPLVSAIGKTDANGYAVLSMSLPSDAENHDLQLDVQAQRGDIKKDAENDLKLGAPTRILVQTDKPLYQAGQILHVRTLVFGDDHRAVADKKIYIQGEDVDGTIVFREERNSSRSGLLPPIGLFPIG
jgi:hypothetical protein